MKLKITESVSAKINPDWDRVVYAFIGMTIPIWAIPYWLYRFSAFWGKETTDSWNIDVEIQISEHTKGTSDKGGGD